ncbi:Tripartite ATP-independent periplasmic transporter DctQ component [Caldalkalibacillus thermarum TA2.A1]|uniref:Tripartite ATP-independent periplasmic transporter DctQ component n=1 Tax=Caldalkalibacillus thermarum (strain TA2.A1) TaxID=986075 RepID=F5LA27_CALTT|nr:TRAP transporter small permease [Caldalkalibacillus thermarum]EGL81747.1 Tripartite ATP-independent periplasmic transporter DctQ component [Caldalkalibacillus thermarum TA2.A1]
MGNFVRMVNNGIKYFLILLLAVLIVVVMLQVIFRFVIHQPLAWTEELARYCLVWLTFLGAAYAMSARAHVGVEFLINLVPLGVRKGMVLLAALVSLIFFLIIIGQGYELMQRSMTQLTPVLRLPMGIVYSVIPLSGLIFVMNLFHVTLEEMRKKEEA